MSATANEEKGERDSFRKRLIYATAELEKIKEKIQKEMEDKIRAEIETKIRAEMEDKIRAEMEEKQEKEKIDKIKKDKHQKIVDEYVSEKGQYPTYEYIPIYLKFIEENKVIYSTLKIIRHSTGSGSYHSYNWLYISDERVGFFCISTDNTEKAYLVEDRPFYFLDSELTKNHIRILDQIMYIPSWDNYYNHEIAGIWRHQGDSRTQKPISNLHKRVIEELAKIQSVRSFGEGECIEKDQSSLRKFESIIKLIPGGYKNGPWRPLDGFFGVYLNEETMDLSELVPTL